MFAPKVLLVFPRKAAKRKFISYFPVKVLQVRLRRESAWLLLLERNGNVV
jgi:hypothetical protein